MMIYNFVKEMLLTQNLEMKIIMEELCAEEEHSTKDSDVASTRSFTEVVLKSARRLQEEKEREDGDAGPG